MVSAIFGVLDAKSLDMAPGLVKAPPPVPLVVRWVMRPLDAKTHQSVPIVPMPTQPPVRSARSGHWKKKYRLLKQKGVSLS